MILDKKMELPSKQAQIYRLVIEITGLLVVSFPMMYIYLFTGGKKEPFQRGFYCDDESLKHPDKFIENQTIPMIHCLLIFASLSILIIVPLESLLFVVFKPSQFDASKIFKIPALVLELFRLFSFLVMIGLFNVMITEIGKFSIGRLRPHFLTLCKPNLDNGTCRDDLGYEKYVVISNDKCTRKDDFHNYEKHLNDGRKSFLSGHSSFSFYVAVFLVCYLHCRLTHLHISASTTNWWPYWLLKGIQIFKPYMQFGLLALATYVGMSRISDYMHHPGDVVTGALLGTISGIFNVYFILNLPTRPRIFQDITLPYQITKVNTELQENREGFISERT